MARLQPRNILICFDAFGTLIKPRRAVPTQYGEVARELGLSGFMDADIRNSFKVEFPQIMKEYPYYGRNSRMSAEEWWTNLIHRVFNPLVREEDHQIISEHLAPRLLRRFSSAEGYAFVDDEIGPLLRELRHLRRQQTGHRSGGPPAYRVAVGVLTNSDDRIPGVLTSLGLDVGPLRRGSRLPRTDGLADLSPPPPRGGFAEAQQHDIDFCCTSRDVGYDKPNPAMFRTARALANASIGAPEEEHVGPDWSRGRALWPRRGGTAWTSILVGDDYKKDVCGAVGSGWHAVLVGGERDGEDVPSLPDFTTSASSIQDLVFCRGQGFGAESAATALRWLCEQLAKYQRPLGA
ncbi:hypothetical protein RB600_006402 [Gaeumannomyces tritici]